VEYFIDLKDVHGEETNYCMYDDKKSLTGYQQRLKKFPFVRFNVIHNSNLIYSVEIGSEININIHSSRFEKSINEHKTLTSRLTKNTDTEIPDAQTTILFKLDILLNKKPFIVEKFVSFKKNKNFKKTPFKKVCFLRVGENKKNYKYLNPSTGTGSKHLHRYEVSGHWRTAKGLGKDQNGEYNQSGRTWVKNCIKGQGEYIYKPRVVVK